MHTTKQDLQIFDDALRMKRGAMSARIAAEGLASIAMVLRGIGGDAGTVTPDAGTVTPDAEAAKYAEYAENIRQTSTLWASHLDDLPKPVRETNESLAAAYGGEVGAGKRPAVLAEELTDCPDALAIAIGADALAIAVGSIAIGAVAVLAILAVLIGAEPAGVDTTDWPGVVDDEPGVVDDEPDDDFNDMAGVAFATPDLSGDAETVPVVETSRKLAGTMAARHRSKAEAELEPTLKNGFISAGFAAALLAEIRGLIREESTLKNGFISAGFAGRLLAEIRGLIREESRIKAARLADRGDGPKAEALRRANEPTGENLAGHDKLGDAMKYSHRELRKHPADEFWSVDASIAYYETLETIAQKEEYVAALSSRRRKTFCDEVSERLRNKRREEPKPVGKIWLTRDDSGCFDLWEGRPRWVERANVWSRGAGGWHRVVEMPADTFGGLTSRESIRCYVAESEASSDDI